MSSTPEANAESKKQGPISLDEIIKKKQEEAERQSKIGFVRRERPKPKTDGSLKDRSRQCVVIGAGSRISKRRGGLSTSSVGSSASKPKPKSSVTPTPAKEPEGLDILSKIIPQREEKPSVVAPINPEPPRQQKPAEEKPKEKKSSKKDQKFVFEWSAKDDTLSSSDPLYANGESNTQAHNQFAQEQRKRQQEIEDRKRQLMKTLNVPAKPKVDWNEVHWSKKPLDKMRERDWRIFKEDFSILTKGGGIPNPMRSWEESQIPPEILTTIRKVGYKEPTPIQRAAIPVALGLRDVIGVAETGSGKTASFVIPLLSYILELPALNEITKTDGPYGIILAPTRELAQQIETETRKFCAPLGFRCASIVGGHSIEEQVYKIHEGAEIVIATPGRLVDCLERRILVLSQCCYVVMDEADRMIDLGFEEQVTAILAALPVTNEKPSEEDGDYPTQQETKLLGGKQRYRQTMMYTATWPRAIEHMAEKYLRRPGIVTIGNVGQATDRVEQRVEFVSGETKRAQRLLAILNQQAFAPPVIIFVNLKRNCDYVAKTLNDEGWKAVVMHGSRSQDQREAALSQLRAGTADCLVATDVAGRGIDIPDVSLVVNFQMAKSIEDYTHRIGRTGRAGKSGVAITFVGKEDEDVLLDLKQMISKSPISKMPDELRRYNFSELRAIAK